MIKNSLELLATIAESRNFTGPEINEMNRYFYDLGLQYREARTEALEAVKQSTLKTAWTLTKLAFNATKDTFYGLPKHFFGSGISAETELLSYEKMSEDFATKYPPSSDPRSPQSSELGDFRDNPLTV